MVNPISRNNSFQKKRVGTFKLWSKIAFLSKPEYRLIVSATRSFSSEEINPPFAKAGIKSLMAKVSTSGKISSKSFCCSVAGNAFWCQAAAVKYGKFKAEYIG